MKSIAYVVPYFGKLPKEFDLWLLSCMYNPTIDWLLYIDDRSEHDYPNNVKVKYLQFDDLKKSIQEKYDFEISLDSPYRLCDFKVAYGEIFCNDLMDYDYWGYCDIDLIFGDIRAFLTEEILEKYEKIGFQGHSTIYLNSVEVNKRYREKLDGEEIYRMYFSSKGYENNYFDEKAINKIYNQLEIPYYSEINFANINPMYWNFQLTHQKKQNLMKNKHRIFTYNNGKLYSISLVNDIQIMEEFMYIHFLRRPMKVDHNLYSKEKISILIVPNKFIYKEILEISNNQIKKYSKNRMVLYWITLVWRKRNKISIEKVYTYFKFRLQAKKNMKKMDGE